MTLISYKYKFIFLANMKCASTTIHKLLERFSDEAYIVSKFEKPLGRHDTAYEVKNYIEKKGYEWEDFFVFTTIRNPYDRIVSCYKYEKLLGRKLPNFKKYILQNKFMDEHFVDILTFVSDEFGNMLVDYDNIIKVEELNKKLPSIFQKLGIDYDIEKVPCYNNTENLIKKKPNQKFGDLKFDDEMIHHLRKLDIEDFFYYY